MYWSGYFIVLKQIRDCDHINLQECSQLYHFITVSWLFIKHSTACAGVIYRFIREQYIIFYWNLNIFKL